MPAVPACELLSPQCGRILDRHVRVSKRYVLGLGGPDDRWRAKLAAGKVAPLRELGSCEVKRGEPRVALPQFLALGSRRRCLISISVLPFRLRIELVRTHSYGRLHDAARRCVVQ